MGVAYHSNYLIWCEVGRTDLIRNLYRSYRDVERSGVSLAVADAKIRYHAPARYEDIVAVETTVEKVASRMVTFGYVISNAESGERLATASTTLVSIDSTGRVATIPPELREALERATDLQR